MKAARLNLSSSLCSLCLCGLSPEPIRLLKSSYRAFLATPRY
ncbi:hypothetical protein MYAER_1220 [Microcystis aeruginosa NIES-2549]|uniref:Uncharacterized protein n=1 Tax=Microcystis aeruginosa NIES-2549 TaxID=1641812 RepID=A0A0F6RKK9_MICAE|nr:hypothetical protein MYAER_1220 [Microcystis aeruginosa NIES-2549]AOC51975.1 hypothetical protein amyaer_1238 [Microcystis aeruginosa NIES-2481]